ncbi:SMEK domain-containing protein [Flavobacterium sp. SUN052]|uniref:SMEK domain-containing protein n=1 Tax=Flavobacterium sp. SUN052 TaxID=3002441 RepID=UPI00237DC28D|nr:SMEK domain-containing protein [Flavobacterium sp. SUN052]MEC4004899.1 SMEK domain-containing protein [Flavobacterium sp. SUN052]
MNLRDLRNKISFSFAAIKAMIEMENKVNNMSLNTVLETPFLEILNKCYGYDLENANKIKHNYDAVDGIDEKNNIYVQVTSTFSTTKIESTIDKIIEKNLLKPDSNLIFMFLKDRAALTSAFQNKIEKKIGNRFKFDFEKGLISTTDIFKALSDDINIDKLIKVDEILNSVLDGYMIKSLNLFERIGLSFDDEEIDNAILLSKSIINKRFIVVTASRKLYNYFKENEYNYLDSIELYNNGTSLEAITKFISIVSFQYIDKNRDFESVSCNILKSYYKNNGSLLVVKFTDKPIITRHKKLQQPQTVSGGEARIHNVLSDFFLEISATYYSIESVKEFVINLYPAKTHNSPIQNDNYCILNMTDKFKQELNYIIFGHEFDDKETIKIFKEQPNLKNLTILIPRENKTTSNKRLVNFSLKLEKEILKKFYIYYIDNYFFDNSLNTIKQKFITNSQYQEDENNFYIEPVFHTPDNHKLGTTDILSWINSTSEITVAFIFGAGGVGKTTVCEKIKNSITSEIDNKIVIFINVKDYTTKIIKDDPNSINSPFNINTIYKIACEQIEDLKIETFKINFQFGNIVIIIDGIDEVISTIPSFQIENFIRDLEIIKRDISKGKIIINCRDFYLSELEDKIIDFKTNHKVFSLKEFDEIQAKQYFENKFPSNSNNKIKKYDESIKILKEFDYENEGKYSPYICDSIALIVDCEDLGEDPDSDFSSTILEQKYKADFINYRICQREIAKKTSLNPDLILPIDSYIKFLCKVAIEGKGHLRDNEFQNYLDKNIANLDVEKAIKDNPFFINENNHYKFRYDFQNSVFKLIAIYSKIKNSESFTLTKNFIQNLAHNFRDNSVLSNGLLNKFEKIKDVDIENLSLQVRKLIDEIKIYEESEEELNLESSKRESISNLTIFLIKINEKKFEPIEIIKKLFLTDRVNKNNIKIIDGLILVNVTTSLTKSHCDFDFGDLHFENTYIENYSNFIKCNFNDQSYFDNTCTITKMNYIYNNNQKITIKNKNFHNDFINGHNSLSKILYNIENSGKNVKKCLKNYFENFYVNDRISSFTININELKNKDSYCLSTEEITRILLKHTIVIEFNNDIIKLNKTFHSRINKYLGFDFPFLELNRAIAEIKNNL